MDLYSDNPRDDKPRRKPTKGSPSFHTQIYCQYPRHLCSEVKHSLCKTHRGCLNQTTLTSAARGFASTMGSPCIWTWTSWSTLPFASVTRWMTGEASMDSPAMEDIVSVVELQGPARNEPRGEMQPQQLPVP